MDRRLAAPARLFHAVVVTGAALANACGKEPAEPTTPTTPDGAGTPGETKDASASDGELTLRPSDAGRDADACPPGAERPYPPCYWIR